MAAFTLVLQHAELRREEERPGNRHVGDVLRCKCQERRLLHTTIFSNIHSKERFCRQEDKHPNFRWRHNVHMKVYDSKCLLVKHRLHVWCGGQAEARPEARRGRRGPTWVLSPQGQKARRHLKTPEPPWKWQSDSGTTQCTHRHTHLATKLSNKGILNSIEHLMQP